MVKANNNRVAWSACCIKPVKEKFGKFVAVIETLCDPHENLDTREQHKVFCLLSVISLFCPAFTSGVMYLTKVILHNSIPADFFFYLYGTTSKGN